MRFVHKDPWGKLIVISGEGVTEIQQDRLVPRSGKLAGWYTNHIQRPTAGNAALALSNSGIYELTSKGGRRLQTPLVPDERYHKTIGRDALGDLWVVRKDAGVDHLRRTPQGFAPPERRFANIRLHNVFVAANGDQWYCTSTKGVLLVQHGDMDRMRWYRNDQGAAPAFISLARRAGTTWAGTDDGTVYTLTQDASLSLFNGPTQKPPGRVHRIEFGEGDRLWFAADYGLFTTTKGPRSSWQQVTTMMNEHAGPDLTKTLFLRKNGEVFSPGVGMWRTDPHAAPLLRLPFLREQLPGYRITAAMEDTQGRIHCDLGDRIARVQGSVVSFFPYPSGYTNLRINDLVEWAPDTLLLATAGHGVLVWCNGSVVRSLLDKGADFDGAVRRLRWAGDTLVCATNKGLAVLVRAGARVVEQWSWSRSHGLPVEDVRDAIRMADGFVLATSSGLFIVPHKPSGIGRERVPLRAPDVWVNDVASPTLDGVHTMALGDRLAITVSAIEFNLAEQVEYTYRIDAGMHHACDRGRVVLDRLEAGTHTIGMRARLNKGGWSPEQVVTVRVHPPWWATRWARAGFISSLIALAFFIWERITRSRVRAHLQQARQLVAVNEERRRIAADVHDDLGADLSRLLMHARILETSAAIRDGAVTKGIRGTIDRIDEIVWSLDPRRDTLRGTINFIEQQARELADAHGLRFRTSVSLPDAEIHLPASTRRDVMLIAREALRNVTEHAQAGTLSITCDWSGDMLTLAVEDDGVGMDPAAANGARNGLTNMRERAERLQATLHFGAGPTGGTRVLLRMPVPRNHPIV